MILALSKLAVNIHISITSFWYLALLGMGFTFYYTLPKCCQWVVLLVMSGIFYYFAAVPYTF